MYVSKRNDKCEGISSSTGMPMKRTGYHNEGYPSPAYHNADRMMQQWQDPERPSEVSQVLPQPESTQITIAAYRRRNSCHGDLSNSHHKADEERQSGDLSSCITCHEQNLHETNYNDLSTHSYYNQAGSTNAIKIRQFSPTMSCSTHSCPPGAYRHQSHWTTCSVPGQTHYLGHKDSCSKPRDFLAPYEGVGVPPTPADTIDVEEYLQKSSSASNISPVTLPLECNLQSLPHNATLFVNAVHSSKAEHNAAKQQHMKNTPSTPPESITNSPKGATHRLNQQLQYGWNDIETKVDEEEGRKRNSRYNASLSPPPIMTDDPDLDFLCSDWDPHNFDFLDDANGFAPALMSDQATNWGTRQEVSAYPALPPELGYSVEAGAKVCSLQASSTLVPHHPLDYQYDQFGGYAPVQGSSNGLETFQDPSSTFSTHMSPAQAVLTSQGNDRTSHRSRSKDQLLVELKRRGYSYKDIKVTGQFEEAESTLRGRYRTLTKPKEARVRKPEWGDREVALLLQAVAPYSGAANEHQQFATRNASTMFRRANKIPWKQVAEYMALRGAYKYGNATVKKKWTEIMRAGDIP